MNDLSRVIAGVIRWGSWGEQLSSTKMADMISQCVENGVTTFDHADVYGNYTTEREFGDALIFSGVAREDIQIMSKCGIIKPCSEKPGFIIPHYNTSKRHILESVDQSLDNLNTDYLDVLFIHRPSPLMDFAEMAEAFHQLKESGKVREFGVCDFSTHQIRAIHRYFPISYFQCEASLTHNTPIFDGSIDVCQELGIKPMSWSPVGGERINKKTRSSKKLKQRLEAVAEKYSWTLTEMNLLWLLHHPANIMPIIGAGRANKVKEAVNLSDQIITREQWFEILRTFRMYDML
ncbi:MAG: aldo/keto reductase [Saprospiraceae bacterium]|nr:aldo/keto reductase [Saprospiraceae bacterium]MCB9309997.1 aldo/keto reductase [Lewinellaceae bacterium]